MSPSKQFFILLNSPVLLSWSALFIKIFGVFATLPFVLANYDVDTIALWQLFATFNALVLVLDFGLSPTFTRFVSYAYSRAGGSGLCKSSATTDGEDYIDCNFSVFEVVSMQRLLSNWISIFIVFFMATAGTFYISAFLNKTPDSDEAWVAWWAVVFTSWTIFSSNCYCATLQGLGQIVSQKHMEVFFGILQIISTLSVVFYGGSLLLIVVVQQSFYLLGYIYYRKIVLNRLNEKKGIYLPFNILLWSKLWPATWRSGLGVLASQGIYQLSGILYSRSATVENLASYLLALRFIMAISQFSQVPFIVRIPEMVLLYVDGRKDLLLSVFRRSSLYVYSVFLGLATTIGFFAPEILSFLHSNVNFVPPLFWTFLCFAFFFERIGAAFLQFHTLTNKVVWHKANGISALVVLSLSFLLNSKFSTFAFPLSLLVANMLWYVPYSILSATSCDLGISKRRDIFPIFAFYLIFIAFTTSIIVGCSAEITFFNFCKF